MVTKTMRQSSRSYNDRERQSAVVAHFNRTPQIFKKEMPVIHRSMNATTNRGLTWWEKFKGWIKKLLGGK
jgi:hypothetical protein